MTKKHDKTTSHKLHGNLVEIRLPKTFPVSWSRKCLQKSISMRLAAQVTWVCYKFFYPSTDISKNQSCQSRDKKNRNRPCDTGK